MTIEPRTYTNEEMDSMRSYDNGIVRHNKKGFFITSAVLGFFVIGAFFFVVAYLGIVAAVISLAVFSWWWYSKFKKNMTPHADLAMKSYNQGAREAATTLESALVHVDYYNTFFFGGIAIDVKARKIAIVNFDAFKSDNITKVVFDLDKIENYKYDVCDSSSVLTSGRLAMSMSSSHNTHSIFRTMSNEMDECKAKNGISFHLDDIRNQRVFVALPPICAQEWMLVISKFINDKLEPQPEATFIPYGKSPKDFK